VGYASAGNGSSSHLAGVLFARMANVDLVHVPYKGGAPALTDVIAGQVPLSFGNAQGVLPHVRAGKLRALATTGRKRSAAAPELPTVDEAGVKGYEADSWFGLFAPVRVPRTIVAKLNAEVVRILETPEVRERMAGLGAEPLGLGLAEYTRYVEAELVKWARVVKEAGARAD